MGQNALSATRVTTFLGSEDVLAGPHSFKGLFEGSDLILGLGQGQWVRWDCWSWGLSSTLRMKVLTRIEG